MTHNRRAALQRTLSYLFDTTPLPQRAWDVWVVDNGSRDETAAMLRWSFPQVNLIERPDNEGVWARNYGIRAATGEHVILLDDDSYPLGDTAARSMARLDAEPDVAAVVGRVELPDGGLEACALPAVMLSGAVCARRAALLEAGGFRREFFRKAGEYDLSFRLWGAGWRIERFEDLHYRHDKVQSGRSAALAHRMDLRNNLILVERYLPASMRRPYRADWLRRYAALAAAAGCAAVVGPAVIEAREWAARERAEGRSVLDPAALEAVLEWSAQERAIASWAAEHRVRRVVLADLAKNLFATWRAAVRCGLEIAAIAEGAPAFARTAYRGAPVLSDDQALRLRPDGVIVANINPAQVEARGSALSSAFAGPVLCLWQPRYLDDVAVAGAASSPARAAAAAPSPRGAA